VTELPYGEESGRNDQASQEFGDFVNRVHRKPGVMSGLKHLHRHIVYASFYPEVSFCRQKYRYAARSSRTAEEQDVAVRVLELEAT
jgi:hypothetical protein